jgi:CHAT domain-containing protein/tetratricopeptide (TPR) repeat protein
MHLPIKTFSLATLMLMVTTSFILPTLSISPLVAQTLNKQDKKTEADRLLKEGIAQYDNMNLGGALGKFEQALLIYQEVGDQTGTGETFYRIGQVYHSKQEYQQALNYYQKAIAIQRDIDSTGARITLYTIGRIYYKLKDYQQALDYYQQALAVRQKRDELKPSSVCRDRAWQSIILEGIGLVYKRLAKPQQEFDYYQQAVAIRQELSNCAEQDKPRFYDRRADLFYNTGSVADKLGKYQQSLVFYQQALAIYQRLQERDEQWETLNQIGIVYRQLGEYQQAIKYFQQAQEMNVLPGRFRQGEAFNNIGLLYDRLGKYQQAINSYQKALEFAQKIEDNAEKGIILNNIGTAYHKLENYQQALNFYQQALAIFQKVGNQTSARVSLNNMGLAYDKLGQPQQAQNYYQQALAIVLDVSNNVGKEKPLSPVTLNIEPLRKQENPKVARAEEEMRIYQQAVQQSQKGQYQEALGQFQQALIIARELNDKAEAERILNQIGLAYNALGDYAKALDYYQQALKIREQFGDKMGGEFLLFQNRPEVGKSGAIHFNIGQVYLRLGEYTKALEFFGQASATSKKSGDKAGEVRILNAIGNLYSKLEKYELAKDFYQQSLAIIETIKTDKKLLEGVTLHNISVVYLRQGKYELALDLFQKSLTIYKQFGNRQSEGVILHNIGKAYQELGKSELAWDFYQQALIIAQEIGDKPGEGNAFKNIGYLLEKQNQTELAIVFFKQSVNVREAIRNNIKELPQEQQQSYTQTIAEDYRKLADLLLKQDRILEAQRVLDLLKVQELDEYLRNVRGTKDTTPGIPNLPKEQQIEDGYQAILNKAISLGKELTQLRQKSNRTPEDEQRLAQLVKAQEKIREDFNNFIKSPEVLALVTQRSPESLSQDLLLRMGDFNALQDNLKNLQQKAVLFYPLILDDRIELILTTPDSPPIRRTVQVSKKQLNETIVAFRRALKNPRSNAKIPAQQLYNWLIKPLETELKIADAQTIIYAPDSQLRYIPLAALYDGEKWLVQRYRINNITAASLTDLNTKPLNRSAEKTSLRVLAGAFASGRYSVSVRGKSFDFEGLPFAGIEVKNLAKTIPNTTQLIDQAFTPQYTIPKMDDYNIVHLATHGAFVVGTPEDSFIVFGNGESVTLRDLQKWSLKNVDLVVLSACETGLGGKLGNGEEILGLGYQMQQAGARASIASLWLVDDGGTQALMNAFYTTLEAGKITKAQALQEAQIALITGEEKAMGGQRGLLTTPSVNNQSQTILTNRFSHPYYWASFILIGNGL